MTYISISPGFIALAFPKIIKWPTASHKFVLDYRQRLLHSTSIISSLSNTLLTPSVALLRQTALEHTISYP